MPVPVLNDRKGAETLGELTRCLYALRRIDGLPSPAAQQDLVALQSRISKLQEDFADRLERLIEVAKTQGSSPGIATMLLDVVGRGAEAPALIIGAIKMVSPLEQSVLFYALAELGEGARAAAPMLHEMYRNLSSDADKYPVLVAMAQCRCVEFLPIFEAILSDSRPGSDLSSAALEGARLLGTAARGLIPIIERMSTAPLVFAEWEEERRSTLGALYGNSVRS